MRNNLNLLEIIFAKKDELERVFRERGVILAYIFGSVSKENISSFSDIDIAVLFDDKIDSSSYLDLSLELSFLIKEILRELKREIDLVVLNTASITLKYQVIKYGKVIYSRDEKTRINFETEVLNYYLDTKPIRDESYRALLRRIKEGKFGYVYRPKRSEKKD